ncbi:MAG: DUF2147 domain-containing protein, partial [Hyphococcus sp.]
MVDRLRAGLSMVACVLAGHLTLMGPASANSLLGLYNTGEASEVDTVSGTLDVRFQPCADDSARMCGVIEAAHEGANGGGQTHMPDGQPIIGFTMITGLKPRGDGRFRDGKINAVDESLEKGKMIWYGVKIDQRGDGDLELTGCLAFICPRKMLWKR